MKAIEFLKDIGAVTVPTTAKEIMASPVVTVKGSQTVGEAHEILKEKNIGQLAVVDDNERLVGDIESVIVAGTIIERGKNITVDEVKRTDDYDTFSSGTDLLEIKKALKEVQAVFIADDNKPIGVIKKEDFFKDLK
jgi:predicted transcriptional regulator